MQSYPCAAEASHLLLLIGAEPDSAAEGVDTAVGEATETARTGSGVKTQSKKNDPKVTSTCHCHYVVLCCYHTAGACHICFGFLPFSVLMLVSRHVAMEQ